MLTFVLIDRCEYFGPSFSRVRVRVSWFFDNQSKTSPSRINCISNILSFWVKNEETLESLTEYSIIYTQFSYFFDVFFFEGADKLKKLR